jgi:glycosyltransferase involved in cell wall biosynthesis
MHILHIETGRNLYGGALQVFYILNGLKARGITNTLVCPEGSEISRQAEKDAHVLAVPFFGDLDLTFLPRLCRIILSERPDIVHVHSRRGADIWGGLAGYLTKTPAIITRRVDNPEPAWIARLKYSMYNRIVTISDGIRKVLLTENLPPEKITLIHSAVDFSRYDGPRERDWFFREFGLDPQHKVIGTVAQLIPRKGHHFIVEAAPYILKQFPETRFLFFGQGPLKKELQNLCREKGLENIIYFAGFRTDLERILPCLDVLLHPATMEGLGVSLLQAAASEVPIIGTRAGGIPEIVHHGINGYLIDPGDTEAIVSSLLTLLHDPEKRRLFGQAGRKLVESSFSIDAMVDGYLRIYNEINNIKKSDKGTTP